MRMKNGDKLHENQPLKSLLHLSYLVDLQSFYRCASKLALSNNGLYSPQLLSSKKRLQANLPSRITDLIPKLEIYLDVPSSHSKEPIGVPRAHSHFQKSLGVPSIIQSLFLY